MGGGQEARYSKTTAPWICESRARTVSTAFTALRLLGLSIARRSASLPRAPRLRTDLIMAPPPALLDDFS